MLIKWEEGKIAFPKFSDLEADNDHLYENYTYLFSVDGDSYYLLHNIVFPSKENYSPGKHGDLQDRGAEASRFAGITGYQLYNWYGIRKYCGRCGTLMQHSDKERMVFCPECNNMEYPKICPAVIVVGDARQQTADV